MYSELIRLSYDIVKRIANLQDSEALLKRPFVLEGIRYDYYRAYIPQGVQPLEESYLYKQMRKIREKMLTKQPRLIVYNEMNTVLLKDGTIGLSTDDPAFV